MRCCREGRLTAWEIFSSSLRTSSVNPKSWSWSNLGVLASTLNPLKWRASRSQPVKSKWVTKNSMQRAEPTTSIEIFRQRCLSPKRLHCGVSYTLKKTKPRYIHSWIHSSRQLIPCVLKFNLQDCWKLLDKQGISLLGKEWLRMYTILKFRP